MSATPNEALIITRSDVRRAMTPADFLDAVEFGFLAMARGKAASPHPMHLLTSNGGFHAKGASMSLRRDYVAVKVNGNFPGNPTANGLPTIQGAMLLFDGSNGVLLAIIDSIEVTLRRTAAASTLAARLLARADSRAVLICGCGEQGRAHVEALREVLPVETWMLWDRDAGRAEQLAGELGGTAVAEVASAASHADVIVTCTTSTEPFLDVGMVRPGTFIAAVGADNPGKSEIAPRLMAAATIVTDVTEQCAEMGDLHHAIAVGSATVAKVYSELGQLIDGRRDCRRTDEEIIIFDSTGTGIQDVAAAAAIYERCCSDRLVRSVALSAL